jgi:hypothetical protein
MNAMSPFRIAIASVLFLLSAAGCSDTSAPNPGAPYAGRDYDPRIGGVQITRIYYDEDANLKADGSLNEYIVLQGPDSFPLRKWSLDAGHGLVIPLGDTLFRTRTFYTVGEPEVPNHFASSFNFASWIWAEHDTARLMDDRKNVVSALPY